MLLADEILLASNFPHKQAPAVRIFYILKLNERSYVKQNQFWESWAKSDLQGWSWAGRWLWGWCALLLVDTLSRRHRPPFCSCRRPLSCRPAWSTAWEVSWKDQKLFAARIPDKDHLWLFIFFYLTLIMSMKIVVRQADTLKISTLSTNEQVEDEGLRNFLQPVVPVCRVITWLITHNDFWKAGDRASWKLRARPTWRNKSATCATVIHFEKWRKLSFSKYMSSSSLREILEEIS